MNFVTRALVGFGDVDPAGIVFYPRYFEMLNRAVEAWFADGLGATFASLHLDRKLGVPTVAIASTFTAPSRLGDELDIAIEVEKLGRTSCQVRYDVSCGEEARLSATGTLVCMDLTTHRPIPWPEDIRPGLSAAC